MIQIMTTIKLNNILDITIPDNWKIEKDENITSLFDSDNGLGALQFSFYKMPISKTINVVDELKDYLLDKYADIKVHLVSKFAYSSIINKDLYWRYWLLKKDKTIVFISYNCNEADMGKEDSVIDEIINSIS